MNEAELLNLLDLGEDQEIEFKSAEGGLPKSIWETVSSFAAIQNVAVLCTNQSFNEH